MANPLRILQLEDDPRDTELMIASLRQAGIDCEVVRVDMRAQEELQKLNAQLESRLEERALQLGAANTALTDGERRFVDILDHSPAAICIKDLDGCYRFVNRRWQEAMGRSRDEVIGRTDHDLLPRRIADIYRANDSKVLASGLSLDFEEFGVEDDLQPRVFHSRKFPLRDTGDRPYAICGISTDITDRKRTEQAMSIARREAERANRAKREFLSRMSHDLRTPLNAVLGFAQLLEMDTLSADQRESVAQILQAGRHLLDLMNDVLDISRVESGNLSLSPEPVAVAEIIELVVKLMRPLGAQRQVDVQALPGATGDRHVRADRQRLNQILLHLLSNAIEYNRPGGVASVSVEEVAGGRVRIKVSDTGAGIHPEKLELLFRPFGRLGAERSDVEGTGLGLALSRGLAEAMGGRLGVESAVGRGSTFWIELSCASPATDGPRHVPDASVAGPEAPAPVSGTILYIEDNRSNVRLVERVLRNRRPGVTLINASDGHLGIEMARRHKPDLIFLDLHLPDTSGEEVLRRLWEDTRTREIPVAVLSADATLGQNRRLIAAGARAYLTKPLDVSKMLALVDERLMP